MTGHSCNWAAWGFAALLAAAFVLRALPVGYGLPCTYYPDEPKVITRSLALAQSGMEPNQYIYPPLFMVTIYLTHQGLLRYCACDIMCFGPVRPFLKGDNTSWLSSARKGTLRTGPMFLQCKTPARKVAGACAVC